MKNPPNPKEQFLLLTAIDGSFGEIFSLIPKIDIDYFKNKLISFLLKSRNYFNSEQLEISKNKNITVITKKKEWEDLLSNIPYHDSYHTYDYHMAAKSDSQDAILIKYQSGNNLIALPLLISKVPHTPYYDATSAYGYVGPVSNLVSHDFNPSLFMEYLTDYFNEMKIITVFSRLNPFIPNQDHILSDKGELVNKGKIVNIDVSLPESDQKKQYQRRLRTYINSSRKLCSVKRACNLEEIKEFVKIYHNNMDRVNAHDSYYFDLNYFENLHQSKDFETITLLATECENNSIIAGGLFLIKNGIVQYHIGCTNEEYLHISPVKLIIDEMRLIASQYGYDFFNLGGGLGGSSHDNLFRFKSSFSKDFKDFKVWNYVVDKEAYESIVSKSPKSANMDYFPLYRMPKK